MNLSKALAKARKGHVLAFSREVGGARYILAILKTQRLNKRCIFWGEGPAYEVFLKESGAPASRCFRIEGSNGKGANPSIKFQGSRKSLELAVEVANPDLILLSATPGWNLEKQLLCIAREKAIFTISALDHFWNLTSRFSAPGSSHRWKFIGDKVFAADRRIMKRYRSLGGPPRRISLATNPQLSKHRKISRADQVKTKFRLGLAKDNKYILFASENLFPKSSRSGFEWEQARSADYTKSVRILLKELGKFPEPNRPILLIRPHPAETRNWAKLLAGNPNKHFQISNRGSSSEVISCAEAVVGLNSIFLLESVAQGIPTLNLKAPGISKAAALLAEIEPKIKSIHQKDFRAVIDRLIDP